MILFMIFSAICAGKSFGFLEFGFGFWDFGFGWCSSGSGIFRLSLWLWMAYLSVYMAGEAKGYLFLHQNPEGVQCAIDI